MIEHYAALKALRVAYVANAYIVSVALNRSPAGFLRPLF